MAEWTDEKRKEIIELYRAANPTPETSIKIVEDLATEHGFTVNGIRMILMKAEVYVKKSTTATKTNGDKPASTRVNKAEAISNLSDLIAAEGIEVDDDILGKLTGKQAVYLAGVITQLTAEE